MWLLRQCGVSKEFKLIHGVWGSSFLITTSNPACRLISELEGQSSRPSLCYSLQPATKLHIISLFFVFHISVVNLCYALQVLLPDWRGVRQDSWKEFSVVWCGKTSDLTSDKECKRCQLSYHWHHGVSWDYSKYFISKYLTVLETGESDCHSKSAWF